MAAPQARKGEAKGAAPGSDDAQVVEALRTLIRREMGRLEKTPSSAAPSLKEGMWLLLFCGNTVLLVSRLPREVLSDPAVETAGKLLPALFGSLLVIYLAWFRERLLALTRHRRFNQSQVALLLMLAFTSVPLFRVSPEILPKGTALSIDGKAHKDPRRIWLSCGAHDILLRPGRDAGAEPRQFRFGVRSLLRAAWNQGSRPDWNLLYAVDFTARDTSAKVQIKKLRGEYYDDVFDGTDLDRRDNAELVLAMNGNRARTIRLPLGSYELQWTLGTGQTCPPYQLEVTGSDPKVTGLEEKPCPGR